MLDVFKQKEAHPVNRFIINWILLKCLYRDLQELLTPNILALIQHLSFNSYLRILLSSLPLPLTLIWSVPFVKVQTSATKIHTKLFPISSFSFIYYASVSFYE